MESTENILPPEIARTYEVLHAIRQGGMGALYKVRHRVFDEIRVLKVMHAKLRNDDSACERFYREARQGKQLAHPNIARVLEFFIGSDGNACLIMEMIDGMNLHDRLVLNKGPLAPALVVEIATQCLSALGYLNTRGLVHRDISPDNIMLTRSDDGAVLVKLVDFGIAKSIEEQHGLTEVGMFIGKVVYASPEQISGITDHRGDLYSLGVVLYELLTGQLPIVAAPSSMARAHFVTPPRPFSETDPTNLVPERLRAVIKKALEKDVDLRYQNAEEFASALWGAMSSPNATTLPMRHTAPPASATLPDHRVSDLPPTVISTRAPAPRRRVATVAAVTAFLASGIAATLMWSRHDSQPQKLPSPPTPVISQTDVNISAPAPSATLNASAIAIARGKQLTAEGRIREAYNAFTEAARADPRNANAWANLGAAAMLLKDTPAGTAAYEKALQIDPTNWLAHYNLGCQYARTGRRDDAIREITVAIGRLRESRETVDYASAIRSIRADGALRSLRDDPRFRELLASN
jgi:serine/threonine protein kinase